MRFISILEEKLDLFSHFLRPYIPFTALNAVVRNLDKNADSILDVGCGKGIPMKFINRKKKYFTVGMDIFEPYIYKCKSQGIHQKDLDVNGLLYPAEIKLDEIDKTIGYRLD